MIQLLCWKYTREEYPMSRSPSTTLAAILQFLLCVGFAVFAYPDLSRGAAPDAAGPTKFLVTAMFFAVSIGGVVSAYGIWSNMRWGKVLGLVVNGFFLFLFLGAVVFASPAAKLVSGVMILVNALVIVLLLQRRRQPTAA